jgi:signal transduction histidine kinase
VCQEPATAGDVRAAMPHPAGGGAADPIALEPVDEVVVTTLVDNVYDALRGRAALPTRLEVAVGRRLSTQAETAAYFLVSGALANAAKHAQGSGARVTARCADGLLTVEVADDGTGGAAPGNGSELRGLADRIEAAGGKFSLSSPEGEGTAVRAKMPCG